MMNKISAVIIAKDEEDGIGKCLKSVVWCDEVVVVVDAASTDRTEAIARQYTNKVYVQEWLGYGAQKNWGVKQASHEWILSLDADERVSPELVNEIQQALRNPEYNGYYILFHTYIGGKRLCFGGMQNDWHLRLFKKSTGSFEGQFGGVVHEAVEVDNPGYFKYPIIHLTYQDQAEFLEKVKEYSALEAEKLVRSGVSLSWSDKIRPLLRFVNIYLRKLGLLDGWPGFVNALYLSYYVWRRNRLVKQGQR